MLSLHSNQSTPPFSLSVVVMAYNEEECLPLLLERLTAWLDSCPRLSGWEVIVVDDGSTDGTAAVATAAAMREPRISLQRHDRNRGMGAAVRTGYLAATCDFVAQLPADLQVPPETLNLFLPHLPNTDIVLSVYEDRNETIVRRLLSRGYQVAARLILGRRSDYTGTMVFRRELVDLIPIETDSFVANLEFPLKALARGATHALVTFSPSRRVAGRSKITAVRRIARAFGELLRLRRILESW